MKKDNYLYLLLLIFIIIIYSPNVYAKDGVCSVSSDKTTIRASEEFIINFYYHDIENIDISAAALKLSYDSNVLTFSGITSVNGDFRSSVTDKNGVITLKLNSDNSSAGSSSNVSLANLKFKVKDGTANQTTQIIMSGGNNSYITSTDGINNTCLYPYNKSLDFEIYDSSNDATLSSLKINNGALTPKFKYYIYDYGVSVANNISKVTLSANCKVSGCKIQGLGSNNLSEGVNNLKVKVISPSGRYSNVYTIMVDRAKGSNNETKKTVIEKDTNAYLKSLNVSVGNLSPYFDKKINDYEVSVDYDVKEIKLSAICEGIECTVIGTGKKNLDYGDNEYEIRVVAEDGTVNIYNINVIRSYDLRLSSLIINNYNLLPSFDKDTLFYSVDVDDGVDSLDIMPQTMSPDIEINILGNEDFEAGKNIVKIELKHNNDVNTYTIIVNKSELEDIKKIDNKKSIWDNTYVIIGGIIIGIIIFGFIAWLVYYLIKRRENN